MTEDELVSWGRRIGAVAKAPIFIGLTGPLGAGKSVLARAVARGAGVKGALPSPTFNIAFRYPVPRGARAKGARAKGARARAARAPEAVVHADLFRITAVEELVGIGWEDMLADPGAIVLVEWCGRAGDELPPDRWEITLGFVEDVDRRAVRVRRFGEPSPLPRLPLTIGSVD